MTARIRFVPDPTRMIGQLTDVPAFPGETFVLNAPEAIGDAGHVVIAIDLPPDWTDVGAGRWRTHGHVAGELDYVLRVTPGTDTVDVHVSLTNQSPRIWDRSLAFPCLICGIAPSLADYECARHWARSGQQFRRLISVPRAYSPRPAIQVYSVEGAPPATLLPFANGFQATSSLALEGWLAIQSHSGDGLVAVVSRPESFLFQNMEFSCIHSCPSFGTLAPGQTGEALTRIYFVRSTLEDWHRRMNAEM